MFFFIIEEFWQCLLWKVGDEIFFIFLVLYFEVDLVFEFFVESVDYEFGFKCVSGIRLLVVEYNICDGCVFIVVFIFVVLEKVSVQFNVIKIFFGRSIVFIEVIEEFVIFKGCVVSVVNVEIVVFFQVSD